MSGNTLSTAIDQVEVKVLSNNAFSDFIDTMVTSPEVSFVLKGTVNLNVSTESTDGEAPKTFIVAGLKFSSPSRLPGFNNMAKTTFDHGSEFSIYADTFYFTAIFKFANPTGLKVNFGGLKFNAVDSEGKQLKGSAIDLFQLGPGEDNVSLQLFSKIGDSALFLNRLHDSGDTVTLQGTADTSTNIYLAPALSQLKFTVKYPSVNTIPRQTLPVPPISH